MPVLFLDHIYPEKVFSVGVGKISRNPILHQIEPMYIGCKNVPDDDVEQRPKAT